MEGDKRHMSGRDEGIVERMGRRRIAKEDDSESQGRGKRLLVQTARWLLALPYQFIGCHTKPRGCLCIHSLTRFKDSKPFSGCYSIGLLFSSSLSFFSPQ